MLPHVSNSHSMSARHGSRGKCDVGLFKEQLVIAMPKQDIGVPYSAIQTVAILDRVPGDTKGRILLCLHLDKCACLPTC